MHQHAEVNRFVYDQCMYVRVCVCVYVCVCVCVYVCVCVCGCGVCQPDAISLLGPVHTTNLYHFILLDLFVTGTGNI